MPSSSNLKRKRGPKDGLDSRNGNDLASNPLKRAKSMKDKSRENMETKLKAKGKPQVLENKTKSRDAVAPTKKHREGKKSVFSNGHINGVAKEKLLGNAMHSNKSVAGMTDSLEVGPLERQGHLMQAKDSRSWKLSEPIGGRMVTSDPVFSNDEKYFILASRSAIKIYSIATSLLVRAIKIKVRIKLYPNARIITYCLSKSQHNILWVACSDGEVYKIDWTTGDGADRCWYISTSGCLFMTTTSMKSSERAGDVVFTSEPVIQGGYQIRVHQLQPPDGKIKPASKTVLRSEHKINALQTTDEGSFLVAIAGKNIMIGRLQRTKVGSLKNIAYEFRMVECVSYISSMDIEYHPSSGIDKSQRELPVLNIAVGDVKGSIYVHDDVLREFSDLETGGNVRINPRRLHWHRQAVHTVKYSRDGNYLISGGTETVLVLWQLDTGEKQFLPHLAATIQNLSVSPSGSSYGIQLADNSAMVLTTAELKPIANVAGLQACVVDLDPSPDLLVRRLEDDTYKLPTIQRTPAVISPTHPSRILLGVGQRQTINPKRVAVMNAPFLQTYDFTFGHNISRQAMARSNITNHDRTPRANLVSEPRITHLQMSQDGQWLATVDHWTPPLNDLEFLGHEGKDMEAERQQRREVFLKFWQWHEETSLWSLVSRVDAPHAYEDELGKTGRVADLVTNPCSLMFATLGEDNMVRTWTTNSRSEDRVVVHNKDGKLLPTWNCQHSIVLSKTYMPESPSSGVSEYHGCLAFSGDSSILAATNSASKALFIIDTFSWSIRHTLSHISPAGPIVRLGFLNQYIVILSVDRLILYDLVAESMLYSVNLSDQVRLLSLSQKAEMFHLALDTESQTFAIALPSSSFWGLTQSLLTSKSHHFSHHHEFQQDANTSSLLTQESELYVFGTSHEQPLFKRPLGTLVTALLSTTKSEGYIVLDTAAEIHNLLRKSSMPVTGAARSIAALKLEQLSVEPPSIALGVNEEDDDTLALDLSNDAADDETAPGPEKVVTKEQLTGIFDVGPSFAMPSMEEMFYKVVSLWDSKAIVGNA